MNGCKIPTCRSSMFPVGLILPISSRRKCGMGLIFGICEVPSCVHWLIFFSSLFLTFISHASRPSFTFDRFYRLRLLCLCALCAFTSKGSFLLALCSSPLSWALEAISHLSSAGHHIIRSLHPVVPSVLIWIFESTRVGFCFFLQSWTQGWGGVGLSLARFLVIHSFKISQALTFTISELSIPTGTKTFGNMVWGNGTENMARCVSSRQLLEETCFRREKIFHPKTSVQKQSGGAGRFKSVNFSYQY